MIRAVVNLTILVALCVSAIAEATECFDTYESYQHSGANATRMKQIFNGDDSICATIIWTVGFDSVSEKTETFDGSGRLRLIENRFYEKDSQGRPVVVRVEILNGDGTLRYWKEPKSDLYHLRDGRELTVCEMGEFVPFYLAHQFDGNLGIGCEEEPSNIPLEEDRRSSHNASAPQLGR